MTDTTQPTSTITPPPGFSWKDREINENGKNVTGFEVTYKAAGEEHTAFFVDRLPLSKSIAATEIFGTPNTERGALALSAAIRMNVFDGVPTWEVKNRRDIDNAMDRLDEEGLEAFIYALIERSKTTAGSQAEQDVDTAGN